MSKALLPTPRKTSLGALARAGTIFLDEVESLPPAMQVKLLGVLQEREFEPLGATAPVKADVRVIAASKDELSALVEKGSFRDDLYFLLNVVKLQLPALVERRYDIPLLIDHFIDKFNRKMVRHIARISDEVRECFCSMIFQETSGNWKI